MRIACIPMSAVSSHFWLSFRNSCCTTALQCTTLLYDYTAVLHCCTTLLYDYTAVRLHCCTTALLYNCTASNLFSIILWLHNSQLWQHSSHFWLSSKNACAIKQKYTTPAPIAPVVCVVHPREIPLHQRDLLRRQRCRGECKRRWVGQLRVQALDDGANHRQASQADRPSRLLLHLCTMHY